MRFRGYFSLNHGQGVGQKTIRKDYAAEFNVDEFENAGQCFKRFAGMFIDRFNVEGLSLGDLDEIGRDDRSRPFVLFDLSEDTSGGTVESRAGKSNAEKDLNICC